MSNTLARQQKSRKSPAQPSESNSKNLLDSWLEEPVEQSDISITPDKNAGLDLLNQWADESNFSPTVSNLKETEFQEALDRYRLVCLNGAKPEFAVKLQALLIPFYDVTDDQRSLDVAREKLALWAQADSELTQNYTIVSWLFHKMKLDYDMWESDKRLEAVKFLKSEQGGKYSNSAMSERIITDTVRARNTLEYTQRQNDLKRLELMINWYKKMSDRIHLQARTNQTIASGVTREKLGH